MSISQHRHVFPGFTGPDSQNGGWWHDVNMVHRKYPTAHDQPILGTREFTPGTRGGKRVALTLSFNEWGEPLTQADVDTNVRLYVNPPEYAEGGGESIAVELAKSVAEAKIDAMIEADPALVGYPAPKRK